MVVWWCQWSALTKSKLSKIKNSLVELFQSLGKNEEDYSTSVSRCSVFFVKKFKTTSI